jgi:hypothetical protein
MEPPGSKSFDDLSELKVGARHSQRDQRALQDIHDAAITLGASCLPPPTDNSQTSFPLSDYSPEKSVVYFGGEVKALPDGRLGGYLIRFGNDQEPDLTGDYFTKDTDFGDTDKTDIYWEHGMDRKIGKRKLAKGELRIDDIGVWVETQLQRRDKYEAAIYELAKAGKLGWSSGTAPHLVEREPVGKAWYIKTWPLGLDASMTVTPAEPRGTDIVPLKSLSLDSDIDAIKLAPKEAEAEAAGDAAPAPEVLEQKAEGIELNEQQMAEFVVDVINAYRERLNQSKIEKPQMSGGGTDGTNE